MSTSRAIFVAAALLVTISMTGCAASVLDRREPSPTDVAQPLVTAPTENVTLVEIPKDMYYAGFEYTAERYDGKPKATWLVRGKSLLVTSYGYGTGCSQRPSTIEVVSASEVVIGYKRSTAELCTAALFVGNEAIALPADVTGRPLTVTLVVSTDQPASSAPTFTLD